MPRVIYDSQVFAEQAHGGVSRYFLQLGEHLPRTTAWSPVFAVGLHVNRGVGAVNTFGPHLRLPLLPHTFRAKRWLNAQMMRVFHPAADGRTVYHPTWYDAIAVDRWKDLPLVVTMHDLIPERWPAVTTPRQLVDRRRVLARARAVICVSESTRARLGEHYPWALDRTRVIPLGLRRLPPATGPSGCGDRFYVHVGKRGAYKDFATVLRALAHLPEPLGLVAAGGGEPSAPEQAFVHQHRLGGRVKYVPRVDDQQLANIIEDSLGLVSASREEGFGLPPLEALAAGKPVLLSRIDVYTELYARWARFFEPGSPEALAEAMYESIAHPLPAPPAAELEANFSWERTARLTGDAYQAALG